MRHYTRLHLTFSILFLALAALALRLTFLQVFQGLWYAELADRQFVKQIKTESYRGDILDRNQQILATTVESHSIYINPQELKKSKLSLKLVRQWVPDLDEKLSSSRPFVWLERKTDPANTEKILKNPIQGIGIVPEQKRYYPNGSLASNLIGAVGLDNHGLSGIERLYDSFLRGKPVVLNQFRDGKGRNLNSQTEPHAPLNAMTLTMDRSLQYLAEMEIQKGVQENQAKSGMILLQNPKTGEILAMASFPNFDPNQLVKGGENKKFQISRLSNPPVQKLFEPGSTFKIVAFAAALEEKICSLKDSFFCEEGKWKIASVTIRDHEPEKTLTFSQVLEKSSNIGTAKIGLKLGRKTFYQYVRAFGFGAKTGISLPGEIEGLLTTPAKWSDLSLPVMAFGQEVGVTAMQITNAFSAIANDGVLMEPLILKEMREYCNGQWTEKKFAPQIIRQVVSPQTAKIMQNLLYNAVEKGTGVQAKIKGYTVAGKTGTAQKIDPATKKYSTDKYVASFCGFVPARNPRLVCLVLLDEPNKDYWGGTVAAPIFSRVMSRAVNMLGIPPDDVQPGKRKGSVLLAQKP